MKKYNIIYADPAWKYNKGVHQETFPKRKQTRIERELPYQTMTLDEMKALDIHSISEKDSQLEELNNLLLEKDKQLNTQTEHLEEVETELKEFKPPEIGADRGFGTSEERTTCPMCGAVGGDIKTVEDKTKVLSYVGHIPMYAKKNVCKKCGYEF